MINLLIIVLLIALLALSAFFSGSEIALASANRARIKKKADSGDRRAILVNRIESNYTDSLSTILIGNTLVNIAATSAATILFVGLMGPKGATVAAIVITVVLLIFGEIIPKIVSSAYADHFVYSIARPLRFFMTLFKPVVTAVAAMVGKLEKLWTPKEKKLAVTTDELYTILETIEDEGVFTEEEGELIKSAIEFTDMTAREIMIPRVDIAYFDIEEDDISDLLKDDVRMGYSRLIACRENLDNVIGILSTKRLIKSVLRADKTNVEKLLTEPVYVHMTRTISSILDEFQRTHSHVAVVLDEYGGTMGMLTVEDIIEEIVGEIYDEHDEIEQDYTIQPDGSVIADGGMNIYDLFDLTGIDSRYFESEYTTVGGWATEMLDRFPAPGDTFDYKNLTATILEAQPTRVEKVKFIIHEPPEEEDEE